jgi:hypothetical protein
VTTDEIVELLDSVPAYEEFPTVDEMQAGCEELAASYPEVARLRRVGTSRLGEPLTCLTIGSGRLHALVFAMPHPNEPIGALTTERLARMMCANRRLRDSLDFTWHVVPCIDPDGTRLNEGWFKGPFTRTTYARHFYRPAVEDQVEWTFPCADDDAYFDGVLPETLTLMRLIDEIRPALLCSLHNAETGGVFYYLSRPAPELYAPLHEIPARLGLPLDRGEPEMPWVPVLAPAIFGPMSRAAGYEYLEKLGQDPVAGTMGESSMRYAARHGTFSLVSELPYWADEHAADERDSGESYADLLRRQAEAHERTVAILREALEVAPELTFETPFLRASRGLIGDLEEMAGVVALRAGQAASARPATVAERWSSDGLVILHRIRLGGILLRALAAQVGAGLASPRVREAQARLEKTFSVWCAEAEEATPGAMLPIRSLVAAQLGAILACAAYLQGG